MDFSDIPTIITLAGLEIVLPAGSAIVLAALAQGLPLDQQKRALFYGQVGAFVLRFLDGHGPHHGMWLPTLVPEPTPGKVRTRYR